MNTSKHYKHPISLEREAKPGASPASQAQGASQPITTNVRELAAMLGIGHSMAKQLVASGKIRSVRANKRILIPIAAVHDFLAEKKRNPTTPPGSSDE